MLIVLSKSPKCWASVQKVKGSFSNCALLDRINNIWRSMSMLMFYFQIREPLIYTCTRRTLQTIRPMFDHRMIPSKNRQIPQMCQTNQTFYSNVYSENQTSIVLWIHHGKIRMEVFHHLSHLIAMRKWFFLFCYSCACHTPRCINANEPTANQISNVNLRRAP